MEISLRNSIYIATHTLLTHVVGFPTNNNGEKKIIAPQALGKLVLLSHRKSAPGVNMGDHVGADILTVGISGGMRKSRVGGSTDSSSSTGESLGLTS
jgi:hypothetical protein